MAILVKQKYVKSQSPTQRTRICSRASLTKVSLKKDRFKEIKTSLSLTIARSCMTLCHGLYCTERTDEAYLSHVANIRGPPSCPLMGLRWHTPTGYSSKKVCGLGPETSIGGLKPGFSIIIYTFHNESILFELRSAFTISCCKITPAKCTRQLLL